MSAADLKSATLQHVDHQWKVGCDKKLFVLFKDQQSKKHLQRELGIIQTLKYKGKYLPSNVPVFVIWVIKNNVKASYILKEDLFENNPKTNYSFRPFDAKQVHDLIQSKSKGQWLRHLLGMSSEHTDDSSSPGNANNQSVTSVDTPSTNKEQSNENVFGGLNISESLDIDEMGAYHTPTKPTSSSASDHDDDEACSSGYAGEQSMSQPLPIHLASVPTPTSNRSSSSKGIYHIYLYIIFRYGFMIYEI